jgi:hypothetical protein
MVNDILNTEKRSPRTRLLFSLIITALLLFGSIIKILEISSLVYAGIISILLGFGAGILYGIFVRNLTMIERTIIVIISIVPLLKSIFIIQHWSGLIVLHYSLLIPIGLFLFIAFRMRGKLEYEFPYLGIMSLLALLSFTGN